MLALIPARGGSQGLPGKNIKPLCGKPLIAYTIEAALNSKYIDRIVVSTDDYDIARISQEYGAEVPFIRPSELSTSEASSIDVCIHAIEWFMNNENLKIDKILLLQPTSPLRSASDINAFCEKFIKEQRTTMVAVKKADVPPAWYMRIDSNGVLKPCKFTDEKSISNRQNYSNYYIASGAMYILDYYLLKNNRTYYCDNTGSYIMDPETAVDIDDIYDFLFAESLLKYKNN